MSYSKYATNVIMKFDWQLTTLCNNYKAYFFRPHCKSSIKSYSLRLLFFDLFFVHLYGYLRVLLLQG